MKVTVEEIVEYQRFLLTHAYENYITFYTYYKNICIMKKYYENKSNRFRDIALK